MATAGNNLHSGRVATSATDTDSRLHDGWSYAPASSTCVPEVTLLPILTIYINLALIAGGVYVC